MFLAGQQHQERLAECLHGLHDRRTRHLGVDSRLRLPERGASCAGALRSGGGRLLHGLRQLPHRVCQQQAQRQHQPQGEKHLM
jgi:hypothetical protein